MIAPIIIVRSDPRKLLRIFYHPKKTNNKAKINKTGTQKFMWFDQTELRPRMEEKQYFTMKNRVQKCLRKVFLDSKHKRTQNILLNRRFNDPKTQITH